MSVGTIRTLALFAVWLGSGCSSQPVRAAEFDPAMGSILTEYLQVHKALAADSTEGVLGAVERIETLAGELDPAKAAAENRERFAAIPQDIVTACQKFDDAGDIASFRNAFSELSKPISLWVTVARPGGKHVMYCPMSRSGWVQEGSEAANPYFGAEMVECGYEVDDGG